MNEIPVLLMLAVPLMAVASLLGGFFIGRRTETSDRDMPPIVLILGVLTVVITAFSGVTSPMSWAFIFVGLLLGGLGIGMSCKRAQ